jgi:hypothetical protein
MASYVSKWQHSGKKGGKEGDKKGGTIDAKPETKERLNYALNPKNKDGHDSKSK